jgi:hypothetical protein
MFPLQVLATKGFSTSLRRTIQGRENALSSPVTYAMFIVILVTAAIQVRDINRALMRYGTSQVMPVYYVLFTLASICGSVVLYHEFAVVSGTRRLIFLAGCCITFFGVILITGNRDSECASDSVTEESDGALLEFLGPSASAEDRERVHTVLLSGGIGLALGLVLTPVCFPMFLCCSTLLGAGVGGAAAELKDNRKMHHVDSSVGACPARPLLARLPSPLHCVLTRSRRFACVRSDVEVASWSFCMVEPRKQRVVQRHLKQVKTSSILFKPKIGSFRTVRPRNAARRKICPASCCRRWEAAVSFTGPQMPFEMRNAPM